MTIKFDLHKAMQFVDECGEGESATKDQKLQAWAYLIKTGECWKARPLRIGREAKKLIHEGVISNTGEIIEQPKNKT